MSQTDVLVDAEEEHGSVLRCRGIWRWVVIGLTLAGVAITISQVFYWNPFGSGMLRNTFLYFVLACFLPIVFLAFPMRPAQHDRVPWYDALIAAVALAVPAWFGLNAENIINEGWDYGGPTTALVASFVLWAVVLEALRRTAGLVVTLIAGAFSVYPLFASQMPLDFLTGIQFDLEGTARMHAMGVDSILGLPLQTAAGILVGFLLFGVVLQSVGGGAFFHDLAQSMLGTRRGGSAKVAVVSSASMGMMSGSAVSNVLTTGPLTIPAMKRSGFSGEYAAGVEATASSGGSITPPIMGTAAFLMVSFVGVPYSEIALAAAIPALLYYIGIFTQVDAYSARRGLRGLKRSELPRFFTTLLHGWPYVTALAALTFLLVVYRREAQAPFIIAAALLVYTMLRPTDRLGPRGVADVVFKAGRTIGEILGIIAGVGLIIGGLSMTGVSLSLARELVSAVGGSVVLILIAGAVTSFVLGMGMTVSAVYVLLAIVMAPALVTLGIDPIAAHLFVIYWATVSYITPPVALASFAAAGIAGTKPMKTSLTAMRLGMVKYVIPFCFAANPALVAQGTASEIAVTLVFAIVGVFVMACAFEGYAIGLERHLHPVTRIIGVPAGALILAPEVTSSLIGLAVVVVLAVVTKVLPPRDGTPRKEADAPDAEPNPADAVTAS
ncbi:TRAP transporter permease [Nocardioides campestrisoli]|uniref:TRAP transporter permease n=1 Tax=Nocardioides campestrisoli TaxID=2736757 RepID=UPI00163D8A64|nr:TRAP transporter fused permease subunit [Nocardioides campestrisoli]